MNTDIAVIGGGASGLAAAISAKKNNINAEVTIIERMDKVGRKLLATGSGRCNLGNKTLCSERYHGSINAMKIIGSTPDSAEFFGELGVLCISDSEGRLYPRSNSAATVLNALRLKAAELGVKEMCDFEVIKIDGKIGHFNLYSVNGVIIAKRIIICTGGYASPQYGTDGKMVGLLRKNGYKISKICPADSPLMVTPESVKGLKGIRVKGRVTALSEGRILAEENGEIQFTENSLSGICVFNLSYLYSKYKDRLIINADLLPDMNNKEIIKYLIKIRSSRRRFEAEQFLTGIFTKNLAFYLMKRVLKRQLTDKISDISDEEIKSLAFAIKHLEFTVAGCAPWKNAQVTSGGIHADCINENLESKKEKGVYFAGEILDVDGICGGFNLQWAWSSGIIAGKECAESLIGGKK